MTWDEYQELASRTECDQTRAVARMANLLMSAMKDCNPRQLDAIRINHAALGAAGEARELCAAVERWIYYGRDLDRTNVIEELGDLLWYVSLACNALSLPLSSIPITNLAKLKARYPSRYTDNLAAEENRNRDTEREAMEMHAKNTQGKAQADGLVPLEDADIGKRFIECEKEEENK